MLLSLKAFKTGHGRPSRLNVQCRNVYDMCRLHPTMIPKVPGCSADPRSARDHGQETIKSDARHADGSLSGADEAELAGGAFRQVEHPALDEGPAIVDAHDDAAAVVLVGDPQFGAE